MGTTVPDSGQITLPDEIRQYLKLVSGSQVEFVIVIDEDGQVKIFPLNFSTNKRYEERSLVRCPVRSPIAVG